MSIAGDGVMVILLLPPAPAPARGFALFVVLPCPWLLCSSRSFPALPGFYTLPIDSV
jgi:hypothetical protein